jgi:hypothetical protein
MVASQESQRAAIADAFTADPGAPNLPYLRK